jgi:hypothetical protein
MYYKNGFTCDTLHTMMLEMFDIVSPNHFLKEALEHDTLLWSMILSSLLYWFLNYDILFRYSQ